MAVSKLDFDFSKTLSDIVSNGSRDTKGMESRIAEIARFVSSDKEKTSIIETVKTISTIPDLLKHHKITQVVEVFLNIGSKLSPIVTAIGTAGRALCWISAIILGEKSCNDVTTIVEQSLNKVLNEYKDRQIQEESEGTKRSFKFSLDLLRLAISHLDGGLNENEISLISNSALDKGIELIGKLESIIKRLSVSEDVREVENASDYVELYVTLAMMRYVVLLMLFIILRTCPSTINFGNFIEKIAHEDIERVKQFLSFLTAPKRSQALFFSFLDISKCSVTKKFLRYYNLKFQNIDYLTKGVFTLTPEKWPEHCMCMSKVPLKWLGSDKDISNDQCYFEFESLENANNTFRIRSAKWRNTHVLMTVFVKFCRGMNGNPDKQGEWKIIKFEDGTFALSPKKWPQFFMHMKNNPSGSVCGKEGNPTDQGIWVINDTGRVSTAKCFPI